MPTLPLKTMSDKHEVQATKDRYCTRPSSCNQAMSVQVTTRRRLFKSIAVASVAFLLNTWSDVQGQNDQGCDSRLSGKTVRWIIPGPPGGGYDMYSRLIKPFYEEALKAQVVIDNVPGAGGLIGAKILQEANPDGLTVGILNVPGLLVATLSGVTNAPNPAKDFTILGRVARSQQIWATGSRSRLRSIEDVLKTAEKRPLVFGASDVGRDGFVNIAVTSSLLGLDVEFVVGFRGTRASSLAAIRGDVDLVASKYESILDNIKAGDLRPLLQISTDQISPHPSLKGVPLLGGDKGLAARRAADLGKDVEEVKEDANALADLIGGGRVIAAPLGLEEGLFRCLEQMLYKTLTDPAFEEAAAAASRSLDVAPSSVAHSQIQATAKRVGKFLPIVQEAIRKIRE